MYIAFTSAMHRLLFSTQSVENNFDLGLTNSIKVK